VWEADEVADEQPPPTGPARRAAPRIFISYRRTDAPGHAGRVYDALVRHFGDENVFIDVDDIPPGQSFTQVLDEALAGCDVLLALIGSHWMARGRRLGRRRLDYPDDFVRLEVGGALRRGIVVVPVLVQNAQMPAAAELPPPLAPLAHVQAFELIDRHWGANMRALLAMLGGLDVAALRAARTRPEPEPVVEPEPVGEAPESVPARPRRTGLVVGSALAAVLLVVGVVAAIRSFGGSTTPTSCDTSRGTLTIGMIVPLSGGLSALGLGMSHSADLAVNQANHKCAVPGYTLVLQAEDDQATPQVAAQAATKLASDPNVVGVVGTLNSSTAQMVQPILADGGIVQISPANINPTLTLGESLEAPSRPFSSYFRVAASELFEGAFGAQFLVRKAGKRNIAVIDDGKTYGAGLAETFVQEATKLGATVVAREKVGEKDTDFSGVIAKVRPLSPDAVYYGGEYPVAGPLSKQLAEAGLNIPLMSGDGIIDRQYIALGGRAGDLATNVGAPADQLLPGTAQFIADYEAAHYPEPYEAFGAPTYDATNVVIAAVASAVRDAPWSRDTRAAVKRNMQATDLQGLTGPITFDQYGDVRNKVLTVYTVSGDDFTAVDGSTAALGT
jgi:branched-chain amino acid transport system substrate-binding protein